MLWLATELGPVVYSIQQQMVNSSNFLLILLLLHHHRLYISISDKRYLRPRIERIEPPPNENLSKERKPADKVTEQRSPKLVCQTKGTGALAPS